MSRSDDLVLREVLEALTRLRLSQGPAASGGGPFAAQRSPVAWGAGPVDGAAAGAFAIPLGAGMPWLDEAPPEADLAALVGAEEARAHGGAYLRRELAVETRLPHLCGLGQALREAVPEAGALRGLALDADLLAEARAEDLVFLDLETTGLHRGLVVLLGFMTLGPGERPLTVTQLFPRDHGEEAPLLGEFLERLRAHPVLVTFNGKSFDGPFLESRLRFHGYFEPLRYAHVDLLHLARRLWKGRLPDFRLQTLERRLFGRRRLADLPGSEVPRVWEDYVRYGELRHLPAVWEHNLRDLATLAELLVRAVREVPLVEMEGDEPPG